MPQTLLLADDSVTIQRVIELTFADEDIRVVAVSNGEQAIARVEEQPPDIVLADVGMPGKNGYEVARYIKQSPWLAHIPVLLMTGAFEPIDQAQAAEVGCDGVLAKPFEPHAVISRVKELLARGRSGSASSDVEAAPQPVAADSSSRFAAPTDAIGPGGAPTAPTSRADYFDQLDAAFAKLPGSGKDAPAVDLFRQHATKTPDAAENRWDITLPGAPAQVPPISYASPQADIERPSPPAATPAIASGSPAVSTQPLPPLAEAFAALLAAEQNMPASSQTAWSPAPPMVTDELVEQVTRRVLAQLSDRVMRETVADLVSTLAERLIREEIERIKASIK